MSQSFNNTLAMQDELAQSDLQQIRAEERQRLANNLHDGISPLLAIARMNLEVLKQQTPDNQPGKLLIDNTLSLIQSTVEEVKYLTTDLCQQKNTHFNLMEKLSDFCAKINDTRTLYVDLNVGAGIPIFNKITGTELFNILKELLHNTIKHAEASQASISLLQKNGILMLTYKDNGNGDLPKTVKKQQLGLDSIHLRLQNMGARFQVRATQGVGFRLTANIPLSFDHLK